MFLFRCNFAICSKDRLDVYSRLSKYKLKNLKIYKQNDVYYIGARFHINMEQANKQHKIKGDSIFISMPDLNLCLMTFASLVNYKEKKYKEKMRLYKESMIKVRLKRFDKSYYAKYLDNEDIERIMLKVKEDKEKKQNV